MPAPSSYSPGMPRPSRTVIDAVCPKCVKAWPIPGVNELGGFFADDDNDWCCPACGEEYTENERR